MSLSALQKFFLPPIIASVGLFSAMSFPLATLGDKQITIKFQEEPFFYGRLRDVAIPYVVLTTLFSIGAGVSAGAFCAWRHSSRKSVKFQQELSNLEQHLQDKEALIKELKLSESRLQVSGLKAFLDDDTPLEALQISQPSTVTATQPTTSQKPVATYEQPLNSVPSPAKPTTTNKPNQTVAATAGFASAQNFLSYAQTSANSTNNDASRITITPSEFEELQKQIREMIYQMQTMQDSLRVIPQAKNPEAQVTNKFQVYYDTAHIQEVQMR